MERPNRLADIPRMQRSGVLWFLKKSIKSSDVVGTMLEHSLEASGSLLSEQADWTDSEVSFDRYVRENCCLRLFTIFYAILQCKLSEGEKRLLLTEFEGRVIGYMESGKLDNAIYHDIHDYYDGFQEPAPPHLNPLWNIGLVFARHCGAQSDVKYVTEAGSAFGLSLSATVELLNSTGRSYRILEG